MVSAHCSVDWLFWKKIILLLAATADVALHAVVVTILVSLLPTMQSNVGLEDYFLQRESSQRRHLN